MEPLLTHLTLALGILLEFLILFLLARRRLQRRFFWFFVYIAYAIIESGLRFSAANRGTLYPKIYWWTEIGEVALTLLAFQESFMNAFREYTRLRWFVAVIWSCIGAALFYAVFTALVFPPADAPLRTAIIIDLEVGVNFVLAIVGILYFALTSLFKIKDRRWESGIVSGFTIYISLAVCGYLIRSIWGTRFPFLNAWLSPIGYILAEVTWALELSRPEPSPPPPIRDLAVDDLTKLEQYSKVLQRILGRKS